MLQVLGATLKTVPLERQSHAIADMLIVPSVYTAVSVRCLSLSQEGQHPNRPLLSLLKMLSRLSLISA